MEWQTCHFRLWNEKKKREMKTSCPLGDRQVGAGAIPAFEDAFSPGLPVWANSNLELTAPPPQAQIKTHFSVGASKEKDG